MRRRNVSVCMRVMCKHGMMFHSDKALSRGFERVGDGRYRVWHDVSEVRFSCALDAGADAKLGLYEESFNGFPVEEFESIAPLSGCPYAAEHAVSLKQVALNKELCRKCVLAHSRPEFMPIFEAMWEEGAVWCPGQTPEGRIGKQEIHTTAVPEFCEYGVEQLVSQRVNDEDDSG